MNPSTDHAALAYWKKAPRHNITCLTALPPLAHNKFVSTRQIVSGSSSGELCIWREPPSVVDWKPSGTSAVEKLIELHISNLKSNPHPPLEAVAIVIGRRDPNIAVTAVCAFWFEMKAVVVAAYEDGFLTVHDMFSGDCISSVHVLPAGFVPEQLHSFRTRKRDAFVRLVCVPGARQTSASLVCVRIGLGEGYTGSLSLLSTLEHSHCLVGAALVHPHIIPTGPAETDQCQTALIVSLDSAGRLYLWDLNTPTTPKTVLQRELILCEGVSPVSLCSLDLSPDGRSLVLVHSSGFQVLNYRVGADLQLEIASTGSCAMDGIEAVIGGGFASSDRILVVRQHGRPHLVYNVATTPPTLQCALDSSQVASLQSEGGESLARPSWLAYSESLFVAHGTDIIDEFRNESLPSVSTEDTLYPDFVASVHRTFSHETEASADRITTSTVIDSASDGPRLVSGFESGLIKCRQLSPAGDVCHLSGHTFAVTALRSSLILLPTSSSEDSVRREILLFSGAADGVVLIWSLSSQTCLARFRCHTGPVLSFRIVDASLFYAIGSDCSFSLYSLVVPDADGGDSSTTSRLSTDLLMVGTGHDNIVRHLLRSSWCSLANYVVSVSRSNTVYVWSVTSGNLERVLKGASARLFLVSRGLATAAMSPLTPPSSLDDSLDDLDKSNSPVDELSDLFFLGVGSDAGPFVEKTHPDAAFGTLVGLNSSVNVDVLVVDIASLLRLQRRFRERQKCSRDRPSSSTLNGHACAAVSLLLDWGLDAAVDADMRSAMSVFDPKDVLECLCGDSPQHLLSRAVFGSVIDSKGQRKTKTRSQSPFSLTLLLPSSSLFGRWEFSHRFSALHSLHINTVCMWLLSSQSAAQQALFSRAIATYTILLPDALPTYKEPSLRVRWVGVRLLIHCCLTPASLQILSAYGLHDDPAIHLAARMLLQGSVERMSALRRRSVFKHWAKIFASFFNFPAPASTPQPSTARSFVSRNSLRLLRHPSRDYGLSDSLSKLDVQSHSDERLIAVMVLSIIGARHHSKQQQVLRRRSQEESERDAADAGAASEDAALFDDALCKMVTRSLIDVISTASAGGSNNPVRVSLALDLVGEGISLWQNFIPDLPALLTELLLLSNSKNSAISSSALRALLEAACVDPALFVATMGFQALKSDRVEASIRASAVKAMFALVKKYPVVLVGSTLPLVVETVAHCLDPSEPTTRRILMRPSTAVLHMLTKKYPMLAFHQISQMFAVGTDAGRGSSIVVYDLRTATKWRVFTGHTSDVSAVAFNEPGTLLASYSANESPPSLRIWKIGASGLISGLLGMQSHCAKTIVVAPSAMASTTSADILQRVSLTWTSPTSFSLVREDKSICRFSV